MWRLKVRTLLVTLLLISLDVSSFSATGEIFDGKVITRVRHGIEKNLEYIDGNHQRVNVDCLFGVVLSTAFIADAYRNGSHIMDDSSLRIIEKSLNILKKTLPLVDPEKFWIARYILDPKIWYKSIEYKEDQLYPFAKIPNYQVLENVLNYQTIELTCSVPDSDFCLRDVVNSTLDLTPKKCFINEFCWRKYYGYDRLDFGYVLTHKLLLMQLAKARNCDIETEKYTKKSKQLCSLIYSEIFNGDYFNRLDNMFDLFLEEIVLCGYEGYSEFFDKKRLYYILKSQRVNGCFPAYLDDSLKTRMKRETNVFEDGCADHTTGLGVAVLSLHYNYIIKKTEDFMYYDMQ